MKDPSIYDVIILGAGIGGTTLGTVLAKKGLKVLLIEAGSHPRFALGESTTPDISGLFKLISLKYDIPEVANLGTFYDLRDTVGPSTGVKRSFSFLFHRENEEQIPTESHQFPTLAPPLGPDCHFFRQDTDAYMLTIALQYGAEVRQQTRIEDFDFSEDEVKLTSTKGEVFKAKYVVDGAGFRSPLAQKFDLREDPGDVLKTNSRAIFTHMMNVKAYDQIPANPQGFNLAYPLSQGTLHHVFEGGWFWIIPFDNHKDSTNHLCSVGLLLNRDIHPETGMEAEEEFFSFVKRFPGVIRQFEGAKSVRNWISTGRIQYSSKNITGHRFSLLAHAASFVDPLYAGGLNLTLRTVDGLAGQIIKAFANNDFSVEQFQHVNDAFQWNVRHYDKIISRSYSSFYDFDLWDAWYRVQMSGGFVQTAITTNRFFGYKLLKEKAFLENSQEYYGGVVGSKFKPYVHFFDKAVAEFDAVIEKDKPEKEAADNIRKMLTPASFIPSYYKLHDTNSRGTPSFTLWESIKLKYWYRFKTTREIGKALFGWPFIRGGIYVLRSISRNNGKARKRKRLYRRDVFKGWNNDWKHPS